MSEENVKSLMDFVKTAKANIKELSPAELEKMLGEVDDVLVVDVREPSEYEQGHIEGALLIPRGILEAAADEQYPKHHPELHIARQRPVVLYCATGGRSAMATWVLQQMGFANVMNMDGGMTRWSQENRPVHREARYV